MCPPRPVRVKIWIKMPILNKACICCFLLRDAISLIAVLNMLNIGYSTFIFCNILFFHHNAEYISMYQKIGRDEGFFDNKIMSYCVLAINGLGVIASVLALVPSCSEMRLSRRKLLILPLLIWWCFAILSFVASLICAYASSYQLNFGSNIILFFANVLYYIWAFFTTISYYQWLNAAKNQDGNVLNVIPTNIPYNQLQSFTEDNDNVIEENNDDVIIEHNDNVVTEQIDDLIMAMFWYYQQILLIINSRRFQKITKKCRVMSLKMMSSKKITTTLL